MLCILLFSFAIKKNKKKSAAKKSYAQSRNGSGFDSCQAGTHQKMNLPTRSVTLSNPVSAFRRPVGG